MNYTELLSFNLPEELPQGYCLHQLTGDASTRSYFRIKEPSGGTVILMKMPEPFNPNDFAYLRNYELFRSIGVQLAAILEMNPSRGFVLLNDLGDHTFHELYPHWTERERFSNFFKALEYQALIEKAIPTDSLSFDIEKFTWELNYFLKHYLIAVGNADLSSDEREELNHHFGRLAGELAERPRFFCHRDYHSRNFMVHNGCVYVIDFQDARYGPATYDLASLCYDSYIQHSPALIQHLEQAFFIRHPNNDTQRYEYPRMCLQRNLKALGTFGYQSTVMGRTFYLQFVPATLEYVRNHFKRLPEYADLSKILSRYLPELRP
ncbi:MAG TPA: phosphotransferase [Acidobacteriota bacterium]|nr:phosphotransferase [Acidobacteriota bacterium]